MPSRRENGAHIVQATTFGNPGPEATWAQGTHHDPSVVVTFIEVAKSLPVVH